jgi:tetratricopeptide (TPR) repeat protein
MDEVGSFADTLAPFRVGGFERLFVLGTSRRQSITIYSQQLRALVLASALAEQLEAPSSIAIVGGGIGGLMLARALATLSPESDITVIERRASLLHMLVGCRTRWLHPAINLWPKALTTRILPFFKWHPDGGFAHDVAKKWLDEWNAFLIGKSRIRVMLDTHLRGSPQEHGGKIFLDAPGLGTAAFDRAIIAVGFGIEAQFPGAEESPSYWAVDSLEQENVRAAAGARRILISGVGDGGLIDFARARIRGFDHQTTLADFVVRRGRALAARIVDCVDGDPGIFALSCRGIPGDADDTAISTWLARQLRTDTEVTLVGDSVLPFAIPSAPINRVLALRILELDKEGSSFVRGRLEHVERVDDRFRVKISTLPLPLEFDTVVIRHGAASAIRRDFPDIAELHERAIRGDAGELSESVIDEALAWFASLEGKPASVTSSPPVDSRIGGIAASCGWKSLDHFEVARTIRRLRPNADWAHPGDLAGATEEQIAESLAATLEETLPQIPRGEADVRRLQHVVRLLVRAGQHQRAFEIFYGRVRGDEHRSAYEYGLYEEDLVVLNELLAHPFGSAIDRAKLLNSAGFAALALCRLSEAVKLLEEAADVRAKEARLLDAATSEVNLADAYSLLGKSQDASLVAKRASRVLERTSHTGLFRHALGRMLGRESLSDVDRVATSVFQLPEPAPHNVYEHVLANICDVRVFAARILVASSDHQEAIANEALRYFGVDGPRHRHGRTRFDSAIVSCFTAWLLRRFRHAPRGLGAALWEVAGTGDKVWELRCTLAAHRLDPDQFAAPAGEIPPGLAGVDDRDPSIYFVV